MAEAFARVFNQENVSEEEMSRNQADLVDVCFEEGQYDSGIKILDQLRSPRHKPTESHIRQLLYIGLYPPTFTGKEQPLFDPTASPSKMNKHLLSSPLVMSAVTVEAAQKLLIAFANTNSPSSIFRALPRYDTEADQRVDNQFDSVIAKGSACIAQCRNCWQFLAEGYIERKLDAPIPKGKGRRSEASRPEIDSTSAPASPVGQNIWPILEWLLIILEKDESLTTSKENLQYSPLLLTQLPSPRGGNKARWEVDAVLDVVFFCLEQFPSRRQFMGYRLLTLLVNLSSTIYLDFPLFLESVYSRVSSMTTTELSTLLSSLALSPAVIKFKVALLQRFLTAAAASSSQKAPRPKPQARAQPKPRTATSTARIEEAVEATTPSTPASRHQLSSSSAIIGLIEQDTASTPSSGCSPHYLKYELLAAYGNYRKQYGSLDGDAEWPLLLQNGTLKQKIDRVFPMSDAGALAYRQTLDILVDTW